MNYTLRTVTGTRGRAESNAQVSVAIEGTAGAFPPIVLPTPFLQHFRRGATDRFVLDQESVGDPLVVSITVDGGDWFLDELTVEVGGITTRFPFYGWITRDLPATVLAGPACVLAAHPSLQRARRDELERRRGQLQWAAGGGLPDHIAIQDPAALPIDLRFTAERDGGHTLERRKTELNALLVKARLFVDPWDSVDDEHLLYPVLPTPRVRAAWRSDEEFARQCLDGVAPTHLCRVDPNRLDETLAAVPVSDDEDAADAARAGRLFELDYTRFADIPVYDDGQGIRRWCAPSRCLLLVGATGLRPVAIRLEPDGAVLTPSDGDRWQLAKAHVKVGEANLHQVVTHALFTHLAMEPYLLAALRTLSSPHPVYKLLRPHLYGTFSINVEARQVLLARGGVFDEFIATGGPGQGHIRLATLVYRDWTLADNELPRDLERRGVQDLKDYPYAEDAGALWEALEAYVGDTLRPFYETTPLSADLELAAWISELEAHAHLGDERGTTVDDLVRMVTTVLFTVTVQHAAVNFQQYEHFGFVPNAPASMRSPMPSGPVSSGDWVQGLPTQNQSLRQLSVAYLLSRHAPDEQWLLGPWRERWFDEPGPRAAWDRLQQRLAEISDEIDGRNANVAERARPYPWLSPRRVPTSIAV